MVSSVKIQVQIPSKKKVLAGGSPVPLAPKGVKWSENSLGRYAKDQGVYVIHHGGKIKYVGKTDGPTMSFGVRLRREFQETAAQGRHIYPKLEALRVPPDIRVCFFPVEKVRSLVSASHVQWGDTQRTAVLEVVLIQVYKPEFQI